MAKLALATLILVLPCYRPISLINQLLDKSEDETTVQIAKAYKSSMVGSCLALQSSKI